MTYLLGISLISLLQVILGYVFSKKCSIFSKNIEFLEEEKNNIIKAFFIKRVFYLCSVITMIGGIMSFLIDSHISCYVFLAIPLSVSCLYTVYKYNKSKNNLGLYITIITGVLILFIPIVLYIPQISGDKRIFIKGDTLFINGPYSKIIPRKDIISLQIVESIPDIGIRTNGISFGNIEIGHFRTKGNEDILLYLNSPSSKIYFIQTINDEKIYINFIDKNKILRFNK